MRIVSAHFENWAILRDVKLTFGTDPSKPLTVIRAKNGVGKTLSLQGLVWGFYGDGGIRLPYLGPGDTPDGSTCDIKVSIDFVVEEQTDLGLAEVRYSAFRSARERRDGNSFTRLSTEFDLRRWSESGSRSVAVPEDKMRQLLSNELKNIFFTDGDQVATFITGATAASQHYVRNAITSLLGIGLLSETLETARAGKREIQRHNAADSSQELGTLQSELASDGVAREKAVDERAQLLADLEALDPELEAAETALEDALAIGNEKELADDLQKVEQQSTRIKALLAQLRSQHASALVGEQVSGRAMYTPLRAAFSGLVRLREKGDIPRNMLPVLEERLAIGVCICGESLDPASAEGGKHRDAIEALISAQRDVDAVRSRLTELFFSTQASELARTEPTEWPDPEFKQLGSQRDALASQLESNHERLKELDKKIRALTDLNVVAKRQRRDALRAKVSDKSAEIARRDAEIGMLDSRIASNDAKLAALVRSNARFQLWADRLLAAEDVCSVIVKTIGELQDAEVKAVGKRMNDLFFRINSGSRAVLTSPLVGELAQVEITEEFKIRAKTNQGADLDLSSQLNGAGRRALVFSLIWALTEAAQIEMPRVIDTPLGMMDLSVKTNAVEVLSAPPAGGEPKRQVILLLQPSEILGCESALDQAGHWQTLSSTKQMDSATLDLLAARYPDNFDKGAVSVVVCDCSHRIACDVCRYSMWDAVAGSEVN